MAKRKKYTAQFKRESVAQIGRNGMDVKEVAQLLGIHPQTLRKWKLQQQEGELDEDFVALQEELKQLKAQLQQTETERDILKKALKVFARE